MTIDINWSEDRLVAAIEDADTHLSSRVDAVALPCDESSILLRSAGLSKYIKTIREVLVHRVEEL